MFINIIRFLSELYNSFFKPADDFILSLNLCDWVSDAICDSVHLIPFLFVIFLFIELFEHYYYYKLEHLNKLSKKYGPIICALIATMPQCGFSVIATPLYLNKFISRGTLITIYIATSDEALPILLTEPTKYNIILPFLCIKFLIGVIAGYTIDALFPSNCKLKTVINYKNTTETGCCSHKINISKNWKYLIHPLKHTTNVFLVILVISLCLNYCFENYSAETIKQILQTKKLLQPILTAFLGLIPNCGISVLFTMMYLKGILSFASVISGLCSNAGLGLIVLFKRNNNLKDSCFILLLLLIISILSGLIICSLNALL